MAKNLEPSPSAINLNSRALIRPVLFAKVKVMHWKIHLPGHYPSLIISQQVANSLSIIDTAKNATLWATVGPA